MTKKTKKNILTPMVLALAVFVLWSPRADAKIEIEGDREFRDDVNECLNTYRGAAGIVGDAIKELENSENTHKIIEDGDWNNNPNDGDNARNGTGTGTTTKVSKEELEEIKKNTESLKNKDFCTAFLHELWHAVDADRGQWSDEKKEGIWVDEIEATIFQNFIHALRGVDPRTKYGNADLSEYILTAGGKAEKQKNEDENETGTEQEEDKTASDDEGSGEEEAETSVSMAFEHVAPGEYSEVYVTIRTSPGATVEATLTGPGVDSAPNQTMTANAEGIARFTWRIVSYGPYVVTGTSNGSSFNSTVNVQ